LKSLRSITHYLDAGWFIMIGLTLLIIQPLLQPGLPTTADIPIHLFRTLEYNQTLSSTWWIPRWSTNLAFGYGYPLFIFAPPLPYIIGSGLHAFGFTFEIALKILMIITIWLYAIGMYLFARDLYQTVHAGLIAGVAYAFAPFALREVLLYGGNLPQYLAIALFPWMLWAILQIAYKQQWSWVFIATLFYAAIMLSHLFHVLIITPVVILFGGLLWLVYPQTKSRLLALIQLLTPVPLGLLLSAFFWVPAFLERYNTRAQADIYLEKSPFFIRYPYWSELISWIYPLDVRAANPYVPLTLSLVTLSLATLGVLSSIWNKRYRLKEKKSEKSDTISYSLPIIIYFFSMVLLTLGMVLPISHSVWETITILQVAEFPWRLLGLVNLGLAVLAGGSVLLIPQQWRNWFTVVAITGLIGAILPLLYPIIPFTQYGNPTLIDLVAYERRSQSIGTTTLGEYLPQTVEIVPSGSPIVDKFTKHQTPERLDYNSLPPQATANLRKQTATQFHYQVDTPTDFKLRLWHYYYPGWQATLNNKPITLIPEPETGFMMIDIPAGQHEIHITLTETPLRWGTLLLSLVTGLAMMALWLIPKKSTTFERSVKFNIPNVRITVLIIIGFMITVFLVKPALRPYLTIHSPPKQVIPAQYQVDIPFEYGIRLRGYDISAVVVSAGTRLDIVLYWESDQAPINVNLQPFVHLDYLHMLTTVAETANYTPGDVTTETVLPTFHWTPGRYIRDEHHLIIPHNIPPIAYNIHVGLLDPDQGFQPIRLANRNEDIARLTTLNVVEPWYDRLYSWWKPTPYQSITAEFGDIQLTGFSVDTLTTNQLEFTLVWQTETKLMTDYVVFAQLLDANNKLVASYDSPPIDGAYPTTTWLPNQSIIDSRFIPLTNLSSGTYRLIVGLYDPLTEQRLITAQQTDFIELDTVSIP